MIVQGYDEMKKFLPSLMMKGTPELFNDALEIAQDSLVADIIGSDLESVLEPRNTNDAKLLKLCQRAITLDAFIRSIPDVDLVLTDAGFAVTNNDQMAPASRERVKALLDSTREKLNDSRDKIIEYLLRTSAYDSWRGTEEFGRLSDGLILTFSEFKDVAVLNNATAKAFPHSWNEFLELNPALNVALMTDVASYISKDYAEQIIEKIRDKETFLPIEQKVLKLVKIAIAAIALGDRDLGTQHAIAAMGIMRANLDDFPLYRDSPEAMEVTINHSDTPIFSMF